MEIVRINRLAEFNRSLRKYYNLHDIRVIDVELYGSEEMMHCHKKIAEVLFILDGDIIVDMKDEKNIEVRKNEMIVFNPGEYHRVRPVNQYTRILVFKYIKTGNELLELFTNDWEN